MVNKIKWAILIILFTASICYGATDDSTLKIVTIEAKDLWGEPSGFSYFREDCNAASSCINYMFDGSYLVPLNNAAGNAVSSRPTAFFFDSYETPTTEFFLRVADDGATNAVSIISNGLVGSDTKEVGGWLTGYNAIGVGQFCGFFCFDDLYGGVVRSWAVTPQGIYFYNGGAYVSSITNPILTYTTTDASYADIWSGRLFIGGGRYLIYSAATNKSDFTISTTGGGVLTTPDSSRILGLYAHTQGLTVVTDTGLWLLSGSDLPASWSFIKIKPMFPMTAHRTSNGKLIIFERISSLNIYMCDGISVSQVGNMAKIFYEYWQTSSIIPTSQLVPVSADIEQDNLMVEFVFIGTGSPEAIYHKYVACYNITNQKISRLNSITMYKRGKYFVFKDNYVTANDYKGKPVAELWQSGNISDTSLTNQQGVVTYKTSLDGVASNRKQVQRIEVDHGGFGLYTTAEIEIEGYQTTAKTFNLYYNTSSASRTVSFNAGVPCYTYYFTIKSTSLPIRRVRIYYRDIGDNKKVGTL